MLIFNLLKNQTTKFFFCRCEHFSIETRLIRNKWLKYKMANENLPSPRHDPVVKILDTPEYRSIFTPELEKLANIFKSYNYEIRIAGGAVRDILMGFYPKDLDFATNATPTQMIEMFTKENIRMINTNGIKHGTITSRINDKENFEVTTLRIDVVTNGRHADVEFTTDWLLDASRRDLTINSMYLDLDGKVYDYFYGYDDLMKKRIAFVGDPAQRICEDFLRIFRYFRFYGRIADVPENHDENIINAIKQNVDGLEIISGERIWSEWSKILAGKFNKELTRKIIECGCYKYMGLPENLNLEHFDQICTNAEKNNVILRPISLVAALVNTLDEVINLHMRLKLTNYDRNLALFIVHNREPQNSLKPYQKIVLHTIGKVSDVREYICELFKYQGNFKLLEEFKQWNHHFPINGRAVLPFLNENHKSVGEVLSKLKDIWLDNNCQMSDKELESYIPQIAEEVMSNMQKQIKVRLEEKNRKKGRKKDIMN